MSGPDTGGSWQGVGTGRRDGSPPRRRPRTAPALPALVLAGIVAVQVSAGVSLALLPPEAPGPSGPSGTLPTPRPAAAAGTTDPEAPPPRRVTIERLGIDSTLVGLKVQRDGTLQVPADFDQAGWHRAGVAPGDAGPAVLVGHVDSYKGPAVFFRLRELVPGDRVAVTRADGSIVAFEVYGQETVAKDLFPSERVYGATAGPELRLVTCGGRFDRATRSYTDNVVVYARLAPEQAAA